ncbi:MAG: F0F1 ATP synthase subunit delta, partial [Gammaproteobacteria bacterium]|nr:F0F1 ATP synthase subunit delta [Gammaproteobacteria bacterium]
MAEPVTLARPYAKAAFQSARDNDALATWSKSLRDIAL